MDSEPKDDVDASGSRGSVSSDEGSTGRRAEAEFSPAVREVVAGRSGYKCALPECGRLTIGPGPPGKAEVSGVCSHIFSAALNGPRGRGGLSPDELKSAANGIWTCGSHAALIDKSKGVRYPAEVLRSFRDLHETRVAHEQGNMTPQASWVQQVCVHSSPIFSPGSTLGLGKVTLITGLNGTGKSVLSQWIAGFGSPSFFEEWEVHPGHRGLDVSMKCLTSTGSYEQRVQVARTGDIRYGLNGQEVPVLPMPFRTLYLKPYSSGLSRGGDEFNSLRIVADRLSLSIPTVRNLVRLFEKKPDEVVRGIRLVRVDGQDQIHADVRGTQPNLQFLQLSTGEQTAVLFRLIDIQAEALAEASPVLVLLDGGVVSLDSVALKDGLAFFSERGRRFQTVVALVQHPGLCLNLPNVDHVRFEGKAGSVQIEAGVSQDADD